MGRLFVVADAPWGKVIHNLGSLTLQSFITSFGPRSMNNFGPPIRDGGLFVRAESITRFVKHQLSVSLRWAGNG
jgi:hypothetical protein